ncbi:ribosome biogenesis protein bop1-like, partial [Cyanistes caeruleus]|uniref:ribosome biogenesis protein bop1-like n=1 Tax=Cyanistes caeruleus TaxID=156563 RepID=UPI000CDA5D19
MEWYRDFPHLGYDLDGKRIFKPLRSRDQLELFLEKMENPEYWRSVEDPQTGAEVPLSEEQLELIRRLQSGQFGDPEFDPYQVSPEPPEFPPGMLGRAGIPAGNAGKGRNSHRECWEGPEFPPG